VVVKRLVYRAIIFEIVMHTRIVCLCGEIRHINWRLSFMLISFSPRVYWSVCHQTSVMMSLH